MARIVFWLAVLCGIGYGCYRFAAWHVLLQLALITALGAWLVIGMALVGRHVRDRGHSFETKPRTEIVPLMAHTRELFVQRYGEGHAVWTEQGNPQIWREIALGLRPQP